MAKSLNRFINQIDMVLIGYLIWESVDIPDYFGRKLWDQPRYLQLEIHDWCMAKATKAQAKVAH